MAKVPLTDKPGKTNWVQKYDALKPKGSNWIRRTAEHLKGKGMPDGQAIATAVNAAKKACSTGDLNFPGHQSVNPGSRAQACEAVRIWEAAKAKARAARVSEAELRMGEPEDPATIEELRTRRADSGALIEGLVLLGDDERDREELLAEAVATVRRWAYGLNEEGDRVPRVLCRQAMEAEAAWDIERLSTRARLIEEGRLSGQERFSDADFIAEAVFTEGFHPRDRLGRFKEKFGQLQASGTPAQLRSLRSELVKFHEKLDINSPESSEAARMVTELRRTAEQREGGGSMHDRLAAVAGGGEEGQQMARAQEALSSRLSRLAKQGTRGAEAENDPQVKRARARIDELSGSGRTRPR